MGFLHFDSCYQHSLSLFLLPCRPLSYKTFLPSPLEEGVLLCSVDCLEWAMDGFHAWESKVLEHSNVI